MSEWHKYCQSLFPKKYREVKITKNLLIDEDEPELGTEEITHIADICIGNYIIEFQHSPISQEEFDDRTIFYLNSDYKLIWIFDFNDKQLEEYDYNKWKINYAPKCVNSWDPKDYKNLALCFEYDDLLYRVCWARPVTDDYDFYLDYVVNWSRVCTKNLFNSSINTMEDMANHLIKKCE